MSNEKQEIRRLREKLSMARIACGQTAQSLIDADVWVNDESTADRIFAMYREAQNLQKKIEAFLKEIEAS